MSNYLLLVQVEETMSSRSAIVLLLLVFVLALSKALPTPPSKGTLSNGTEMSVLLSWTYGSPKNLTNYVIQFKPTVSNKGLVQSGAILDQNHLIASLTPGTKYVFSVFALTSVGRVEVRTAVTSQNHIGRNDEAVLVPDEPKPEERPLQLIASDLTTRSAALRWGKPIGFTPVEYRVSYDAEKEYVDSNGITESQHFVRKELILSPDTNFIVLNDLAPFTMYSINVTAVPPPCNNDLYQANGSIWVTTPMAAPPPMVKPDFCIQDGEVNLYLPHASEENGPISHYYLVVVPDMRNLIQKTPGYFTIENMAEVPGLQTKIVPSSGMIFRPPVGIDDLRTSPKRTFEVVVGPYIAAKFLARDIPLRFWLGDGNSYHGYRNKELRKEARYRIFLRAVVDTPEKNLFTSSPFSEPIALSLQATNAC